MSKRPRLDDAPPPQAASGIAPWTVPELHRQLLQVLTRVLVVEPRVVLERTLVGRYMAHVKEAWPQPKVFMDTVVPLTVHTVLDAYYNMVALPSIVTFREALGAVQVAAATLLHVLPPDAHVVLWLPTTPADALCAAAAAIAFDLAAFGRRLNGVWDGDRRLEPIGREVVLVYCCLEVTPEGMARMRWHVDQFKAAWGLASVTIGLVSGITTDRHAPARAAALRGDLLLNAAPGGRDFSEPRPLRAALLVGHPNVTPAQFDMAAQAFLSSKRAVMGGAHHVIDEFLTRDAPMVLPVWRLPPGCHGILMPPGAHAGRVFQPLVAVDEQPLALKAHAIILLNQGLQWIETAAGIPLPLAPPRAVAVATPPPPVVHVAPEPAVAEEEAAEVDPFAPDADPWANIDTDGWQFNPDDGDMFFTAMRRMAQLRITHT